MLSLLIGMPEFPHSIQITIKPVNFVHVQLMAY